MEENLSINNDQDKYEILLIGQGPAGLAFLSKLNKNLKYLAVDMGKPVHLRNHEDLKDMVCGQGGAGLFSDGKFSFFPSGSKLWESLDTHLLKQSFQYLTNDFKEFFLENNIQIPDFPEQNNQQPYVKLNQWSLKAYPSFYLSLEQRIRLIQKLENQIDKNKVMYNSKMIKFTKTSQKTYLIHIQSMINPEKIRIVESKTLILAGGRFFPLQISKVPYNKLHYEEKNNIIPQIFKRIEFGVRICAHSKHPIFNIACNLLDHKYVYLIKEKEFTAEFRTFCWCKQGQIQLTNFDGIQTFSGRSDCPQTNESNFGFMCRILKINNESDTLDQNQIYKIMHKLINIPSFSLKLGAFSFSDSFEQIRKIFGSFLGNCLIKGLEKFIQGFDLINNREKLCLYGPCIEGVGNYPYIDNEQMKVKNESIYCIGDASGVYRGIIPCMISGYSLAQKFE